MDVSISGIVMDVLIDSASVSNLMGIEYFQKLRGLGFNGDIEHFSKKRLLMGERKVMLSANLGLKFLLEM